jgi:hypothetical protein
MKIILTRIIINRVPIITHYHQAMKIANILIFKIKKIQIVSIIQILNVFIVGVKKH